MHRFIALLSLCIFMGVTQSADAQTRSGRGTLLNDRGAARGDRRFMPATNPRFVQDAVRRAQERRTRMEARKRLGQSIARPTVQVGPSAMFTHAYSNALRSISRYSSYGRRYFGMTENNLSSRMEYYSPPYLWSPIYESIR